MFGLLVDLRSLKCPNMYHRFLEAKNNFLCYKLIVFFSQTLANTSQTTNSFQICWKKIKPVFELQNLILKLDLMDGEGSMCKRFG